MKKILYIIGILMMATAVVRPLLVLGADESYSADSYTTTSIFSYILPKEMSDNMFESFGQKDDSKMGKDLYLKILKKTVVNPDNAAVKKTAGGYGMSQNDMEFVRAGSYQPLLAKRPTMSQEDLINKMNTMRAKLDEQQQILSFQADIEQATTPSEIFANGDVKDSGFDLINDLQIIENLLFLKSEPIDIGNSYNKEEDEGGGTGEQPAAAEQPAEQTGQPNPQTPPQATVPVGGTQKGTQETTQEQCPPGSEPDTSQGSSGASSAAASAESAGQTQCSTASPLQKAIDDAERKAGAAKGTGALKCKPIGQGSGTQGAQGGASGTQESNTGSKIASLTVTPFITEDPFPELPKPEAPPVEAASADDWKKDRVCWGKFCLTITYVYETPTSKYMDSDNCIACHIEKINEQMKKTISHSLSPNKIPGNMIETPKCKNGLGASLGSLSMNLNVQFMPIKTPINDDLILGSSVQDDWKYFCEATAFFPSAACKNLGNDAATPRVEDLPSLDEQATKRILSMAPDTIDFEAVVTKSNQDVTAQKEQQAVMEKQLSTERNANPNLLLYKSLLIEIDQMIYYFANINDVLHSLHEKVNSIPGEQACKTFKNKKVCS